VWANPPNTAPLRGIYDVHPNPGNPGIDQLRQANAAAMVVGVGAFSSNLRGLKLVSSKWRSLVPLTSPHDPLQVTPRGC